MEINLDNSLIFDIELVLPAMTKATVKFMNNASLRSKYVPFINTFVLNFIRLISSKKECLAISKDKNDYYYVSSYSKMMHVYDQLIANDLIKEVPGFFDKFNPENSRTTRIWPTEKAVNLLENFDQREFKKGIKTLSKKVDTVNDAIVMKDMEKKVVKLSKELDFYKKQLQEGKDIVKINKFMWNVDIDFIDPYTYVPQVQFRRIYSRCKPSKEIIKIAEELQYGGRLYAYYMNLSKDYRKRLLLNRKPVCEIDFSAMSPTIFYALEGLKAPDNIYGVDIPEIPLSSDEIRTICKHIFVKLTNCSSAPQRFFDNIHKWLKVKKGIQLRTDHLKMIYDAFVEKHEAISKYFLNKKNASGLLAQKIDSDIALDIVKHFVLVKKVPCLPIHDSFIVQKEYEEELMQVMLETFKKHTGQEAKLKKEF